MKRVAAWTALGVLVAGAGAGAAERRQVRVPGRTDDRPYSDAVQAGDTVYLSGKTGLEAATNRPPADPAAESRLAMDYTKVYATKDRFPARAFIGSGPLLFGGRFEVQGIAMRPPAEPRRKR